MKKFYLGLLLTVIISGCNFSQSTPTTPPNEKVVSAQIGEVVEFEGVLTDFNDACKIDASCVAYIDGYKIITNFGDIQLSEPMGQSDIWLEDISSVVRVKAVKISDSELSLKGSQDYYIQKVND